MVGDIIYIMSSMYHVVNFRSENSLMYKVLDTLYKKHYVAPEELERRRKEAELKRAAESCDWVQKKMLKQLAGTFAYGHTCMDLYNGSFYAGGSDDYVTPSILCAANRLAAANKRISVQVLKDERNNAFCRLCFNKE